MKTQLTKPILLLIISITIFSCTKDTSNDLSDINSFKEFVADENPTLFNKQNHLYAIVSKIS